METLSPTGEPVYIGCRTERTAMVSLGDLNLRRVSAAPSVRAVGRCASERAPHAVKWQRSRGIINLWLPGAGRPYELSKSDIG